MLRQKLQFLLLALAFGCTGVRAEVSSPSDAPKSVAWDTFSDTWVASDALGRAVPTHAQVGSPRKDRTVGIFYFLWLNGDGSGAPYDVTKILAQDPGAMQKPESPLWGPMYAPHHWGESIFNYYTTDDTSVLRKHAQMLSDAGVDFIFFDVSNQLTYRLQYLELLRVFAECKQNGGNPPKVGFLCPFWKPAKVVAELYRELYEPGLYSDLWFRWQGKPLILADPALLERSENTSAILKFFTFRKPQPDYFQGQTQADMWSWLEVHPQHVFTNSLGQKEQMSVGVAQNAVSNRLGSMSERGAHGRSFHDGAIDPRPNAVLQGLNVAEQWEHALKQDPRCIFVTGWNEWIAGRFPEFNGVREPVMFVDEFNQENSRDIEPMQSGHGDNYYYQLAGYIRRFKGARPLAPIIPQPIRIDGRFNDWQAVTPEFRDTIGDPVQREHRGWNPKIVYTNHTGRNDLVAAKVSYDKSNVYFYVRTREPLTPSTDPNWMLLFIDSDANPNTGWLGYDFVVNRSGVTSQSTTIERNVGGSFQWGSPKKIQFRTAGNELELVIPLAALGLKQLPPNLDFKWADNIQQTGDWSDFTLNGDVAPNDRFNYRAKFVTDEKVMPIRAESSAERDVRHKKIVERRNHSDVIVHRGAAAFAPENTLEAYAAAMDYGADGCEIDIRRTADGVLVMFHDDGLERMTDGFGRIDQHTYAELLALKFRPGLNAKRGSHIPTFAAVLELARHRAMLLHLDVKEAGLEDEITKSIDAADVWDHVVEVNESNAGDLRNNPKVHRLAYKAPGLGRLDMDPDRVKEDLAKPGNMIMVDDPRVSARELNRAVMRVALPGDVRAAMPANLTVTSTNALAPAAHLRGFAKRVDVRSLDQLESILKADFPERTDLEGDAAYQEQRALRILERAWAAAKIGQLKRKTLRTIPLLERQVTGRSLHRQWAYQGLDGIMAVRALGALKATDVAPSLIRAFQSVDPILKKLADPSMKYPYAWGDFGLKREIIVTLGQLHCQPAKEFLADYLAMDETAVGQFAPPLFEEATRAFLQQKVSPEELEKLLRSPNSDIRGTAILVCLDRSNESRVSALHKILPWTKELPAAP